MAEEGISLLWTPKIKAVPRFWRGSPLQTPLPAPEGVVPKKPKALNQVCFSGQTVEVGSEPSSEHDLLAREFVDAGFAVHTLPGPGLLASVTIALLGRQPVACLPPSRACHRDGVALSLSEMARRVRVPRPAARTEPPGPCRCGIAPGCAPSPRARRLLWQRLPASSEASSGSPARSATDGTADAARRDPRHPRPDVDGYPPTSSARVLFGRRVSILFGLPFHVHRTLHMCIHTNTHV
jgi:hypothetical protein